MSIPSVNSSSRKKVQWDESVYVYRYKTGLLDVAKTEGYKVSIPGEKEDRIIILEQIFKNHVAIRYQTDDDCIRATDSILVEKAIWESWKKSKTW